MLEEGAGKSLMCPYLWFGNLIWSCRGENHSIEREFLLSWDRSRVQRDVWEFQGCMVRLYHKERDINDKKTEKQSTRYYRSTIRTWVKIKNHWYFDLWTYGFWSASYRLVSNRGLWWAHSRGLPSRGRKVRERVCSWLQYPLLRVPRGSRGRTVQKKDKYRFN